MPSSERHAPRARLVTDFALIVLLLAVMLGGYALAASRSLPRTPYAPRRAVEARPTGTSALPTLASLSALPVLAAPRVVDSATLEVHQVTAVLAGRGADSGLAHAIAQSVVRESRRARRRTPQLDIPLVLGVLLVENPDFKPTAKSSVGARGLMQVMPFWAGTLGCTEHDLVSVDGSICHGIRILAAKIRENSGDVHRALLRYNGCVRGTNTPNCHRYPGIVQRRAAEVRRELRLVQAGTVVAALDARSLHLAFGPTRATPFAGAQFRPSIAFAQALD